MKTIYFATGNKGKVLSLQARFNENITVEQIKLEIPEIQHNDVEEIVKEKTKIAYALCKKPVLVQDSAFHIPALSGFPGQCHL